MTRQQAPRGKFRVIGVDTFEGPTEDYLIGDYISLYEARKVADEYGGPMNPTYVYNDKGKILHSAGSF